MLSIIGLGFIRSYIVGSLISRLISDIYTIGGTPAHDHQLRRRAREEKAKMIEIMFGNLF